MVIVGFQWLRRLALIAAAVAGTLCLVAANPAAAQTIVVQGNQRIESETIRSYFQSDPGGRVDQSVIDRGVRDMLATGLFSSVRARRAGSQIVVSVVENSVINRVQFEGADKLKIDQLSGEVQSKSRGPYNPDTVQADVSRLKEVYRRAGRGDAQVEARTDNSPNGRVDVTFIIKEGKKTGVAEINFSGNNVYSARRLKGVMQTTETNFLSWLKTSDVYDPDKIATDMEAIRRHYLKNGYADFRIVTSDATYDEGRRGWVITVIVDEGEQYKISGVDVESRIGDVDPARLRRVVRTSPGDTYNADAVEKSIEAINSEVASRGYAFAQVRPRGERDPANRTIAISYVVEQGARVYVERINVRGNTRTRDYVIRREFDLGEGDAFNKILVDKAERRLKNLEYFKTVKVTTEPGSAPDRVIINVDVEDQATGNFALAAGYSTSDGVLGEFSVTEKNLLGRGQFAKVSLTSGQRSRGFEVSFTEPFFLDRRIAAGFDIFNKWTDNTQFGGYTSRVFGGAIRLAFPITDEFTLGMRYSLYQTRIQIPNTFKKPFDDCSTPLDPTNAILVHQAGPFAGQGLYPACAQNGEASLAVKQARGKTITSLAGLTFLYNTLDNNKNPTSGYIIDIRPEVAGLGGDSRFFRTTGEARYYYPVFDDITLQAKVQGGHVQSFGGSNLRLIDHFFKSYEIVRGFAPNGIGPKDIAAGDPRSGAVGGATYWGTTLELQFPIFGVPRELGIRGALFADAGSLFGYRGSKVFDVNRDTVINGFGATGCVTTGLTVQPECINVRDKKTIRSSVGASLLWNSPLGPIRFDYAFATSRDRGQLSASGVRVGADRVQAFRFSGGASF